MATAEQKSLPKPRRPLWRVGLVAFALVLAAVLAWYWQPLRAKAVAGASFGARIGCSCRFVDGRSLGDCRKDFEPGMGMITLSEDLHERSVTARFPLLSTQTATFREGQGCQLEPWKD